MLTTPRFVFSAWICLPNTRLIYQVAYLTPTLGCVKHLHLDIIQVKYFLSNPLPRPWKPKNKAKCLSHSFPISENNSILPFAQAKHLITAFDMFFLSHTPHPVHWLTRLVLPLRVSGTRPLPTAMVQTTISPMSYSYGLSYWPPFPLQAIHYRANRVVCET